MKRSWSSWSALSIVALWCADARLSTAAEVIFSNGHIYTGNAAAPWAEALAVTGGRIEAIGSNDTVRQSQTSAALQVDLQGRTVIPGVIDSHLHLVQGSFALHGINLSTPELSITPDHPEELIQAIRGYAGSHRQEKILFGRGDFTTDRRFLPQAQMLDRAVSDRPLFVHNTSEHSMWLNSKALALAGITTKAVANPEEERYVMRDASGRPTGILLEGAMELASRAVANALTEGQKTEMLRAAMHYLNSFGITGIVNATGNLADLRLYALLRDRGQLTVRTRTAFGAVSVPHRLTPQFLEDLDEARTLYHDDWVSANLVKFFADGGSSPVPPLVYEPHAYAELVKELDKRGYQIMTHALRPDSVHMILDTYAQVEKSNGPRNRRFRIEHADIVADEDLKRFGELGVIADMQPAFCCSQDDNDSGPPTDRWQTLRSFAPELAFSSDWPCTWPPNPFVAIQQAVTRQAWRSSSRVTLPGESWVGARQAGALPTRDVYDPPDAVTVEQAVNAYTHAAAMAAFFDDHAGVLAKGMDADLAVLSQDIFKVPADQIAKTRVLLTVVGGKTVYSASE